MYNELAIRKGNAARLLWLILQTARLDDLLKKKLYKKKRNNYEVWK